MEELERREIPHLPGYFCDTHGNVYHGDKRLTIGYHNGNYGYVSIYANWSSGKAYQKKVTVARLMAEAWLDATVNDTVCFFDGNNTNCELDNLYLGSKSDFHKSLLRFREDNQVEDGRLCLSVRRTTPVYQLDPETYQIIKEYPSIIDVAKEFNVPANYIYKSCTHDAALIMNTRWCFKDLYPALITSLLEKGDG